MPPDLHECIDCGNSFSGNYCNNCGEKRYTGHDKTVSHIVHEAVHFTTHLDSKYLKTLWLFISKSGLVSKEFCEGRRKKYFKPVSMFLIAIVLYLLFPLLPGLNLKFGTHIANNDTMGIQYSRSWAIQKIRKEKLTDIQFAEKFDHTSPKFAKVLLLLLLPLTALSLSLIFVKKKRYFFDHFILSAEINASVVYLFFIILPLTAIVLSWIFRRNIPYGDHIIFSSAELILVLWVLTKGFMRFYEVKFAKALASSFLFILLFALSVFIYRQLIFILVMLVI